MKSENDILAEYVREHYPKIACSFDFAMYRLAVKVGEAVNHIVDAFSGFQVAESAEDDLAEND